MMREVEDSRILEYVKRGGEQIWIGVRAPFDMSTVDMFSSSNYRVSSSHHHSYDVVWLFETLLDDVGKLGWKLVVDESIRLLREEGRLMIRMRRNGVPSYILLKSFLGRHIGIQTAVEYERYDKESDLWTAVFRIKRLHYEQYLKSDWTFAIMTLGYKVDNVVRFLKSVRDHEPAPGTSEILVMGPHNKEYDEYDVKYLDLSPFRDDEYAEISKKKNAIVKAASGTNLLIAHDRFELAPSFFEGFEKYGYDFDFATVTQYTEDGRMVPCYAAIRDKLRSSPMIWVQEYRHLYDNQYVSGGLTVFKTATIKQVGFNDLLMWDQMEDVELTSVFVERGIVPRVNFASEAFVLETRKGFFESFRDESAGFPEEVIVPAGVQTPARFSLVNKITRNLPKGLKNTKIYQRLKRGYWGGQS